MMALDIGEKTVNNIKKVVDDCKTLLWNGPLGAFEVNPFDNGTNEVAKIVSTKTEEKSLISVAGGGFLLHSLAGNQALFICGIILTWVHFVLDARLWRMSDPGARKLLRERFGFLFS